MIANKVFPQGAGAGSADSFWLWGFGIVVTSPHNSQTFVSQKYNQEYVS